jgi:hypothetical protein
MKIPILLPAVRPGHLLVLLACLLHAPLSRAQNGSPPELLTYQGYLTDANGNPLGATNTGPKNYDVIFRIWDAQTGGNEQYAEQQTVTVSGGYFSVLLGEGSAYQSEPHTLALSTLFTNTSASSRYMEFTVQGAGVNNANVTIAPRLRLVTSPYSFLSTYAVNASAAASLVNASDAQAVSVANNGDVGIGTASPGFPLDVNGIGRFSGGVQVGQGITSGLYGDTANIALRTYASGGIYFQSASGNSTSMYIGSTGDVGIGTTSPGFPLNFPNTVGDKISLYDNVTGGGSYGFGIQSGTLQIHSDSPGTDVAFGYGSSASMTEAMRIKGSGNVGIGTSTPGALLELEKNQPSGDALRISGYGFNQGGPSGGISLLLGVNYVNNKQLWIGDSANLAVNSTNTVIRIMPDGPVIDAIGTDGLTVKPLRFGSGGNVAVGANGWLGIGTTTPGYPLDVESSLYTSVNDYSYLNNSTTPTGHIPGNSGNSYFSIYAAGRIVTAYEFDATSDARIKEILGRSDTRHDLATVRQLQITDYRKVDKVQYGGRVEKGVIAQEVEKVVPEAVSTSTNYIPNIYAMATAIGCSNQTLLVTLAKPHGLVAGDRVRLITEKETLEVRVTAVPSPLVFAVDPVNPAPKQVFVYGKQVGDYRSVNYDRLFTTGLGAIQELAKRMDAVEAREARLAELEQKASQAASLEQEVADLKKLVTQLADAARNSKLTAEGGETAPKTLTTASLDR